MISGDVYECTSCGSIGPYHTFQEHAIECMRGAPELLPGESFNSWVVRVKEWRRERQVQDDKGV
jgi:hypothetical protein